MKNYGVLEKRHGRFGMNKFDLSFYRNKTVLVTGHTGFKGSWLCKTLIMGGANVIGYSLKPENKNNLFSCLQLDKQMISIIGDIRNFNKLNNVFDVYHPEIVFHLAAQPIVRESYIRPVYTYDVNVMGTVNICECVRTHKCVKSFVNVTTDKVYENNDLPNHPFSENEKLDGYDPYSNSKSCSELVTHSYRQSFFKELRIPVSTARAGNVIGGGDFAKDRIIPDAVKSLKNGEELIIRNPDSIRPYQFVLEPLLCYLLLAREQYFNYTICGAYNIGPDSCDISTTKHIIELFASHFGGKLKYRIRSDKGPHEATYLLLSNTKMKKTFCWLPKTNLTDAVKFTAEWYDVWVQGKDVNAITEKQIGCFFDI